MIQQASRKEDSNINLEVASRGNKAGRPVIDSSSSFEKSQKIVFRRIRRQSEGMPHGVL